MTDDKANKELSEKAERENEKVLDILELMKEQVRLMKLVRVAK